MKNDQKIIYPIFSKVVYTSNTKPENKEIINILEEIKIKKFKKVPPASSMSEDVHVLDSKNLKFLKQMLELEIKHYVNGFLKYKNKFKITTSWFTRTEKNGFSNYHNHSNSMFSGCFYIKADPETDKISFVNHSLPTWVLDPEEKNIYNGEKMEFGVCPGFLIMFPSEVFHKILPNINNKERLSLAFNVIPTGNIGYSDSSLNLIKCK
jgi:uncharacterized protein (TIGR02466 family)